MHNIYLFLEYLSIISLFIASSKYLLIEAFNIHKINNGLYLTKIEISSCEQQSTDIIEKKLHSTKLYSKSDDNIESNPTNSFYEYSSIGTKKLMIWDINKKKFRYQRDINHNESKRLRFSKVLHNNFFPSGELSNDYYRYTIWRASQRLVSATNSVFGTQALLLALGFKTKKLGLAAATTWVLKDALGKLSRIIWASKHGGKFDGDAKKWRFRASLLFALGNTLEIVTFILPALFLVSAAMANALKQMAMLTSSATRNTIYKSFSKNADNIGDITAKGEAQTAVIDLLGLLLGIRISRSTNLSKTKIAVVFGLLSIIDLLCVFQEIRSVVFQLLNFERCDLVLRELFKVENKYVNIDSSEHIYSDKNNYYNSNILDDKNNNYNSNILDDKNDNNMNAIISVNLDNSILDNNTITSNNITSIPSVPRKSDASVMEVPPTATIRSSWWHFMFKTKQYRYLDNNNSTSKEKNYIGLITPSEISHQEKLFLPARLGESMIKYWSNLKLSDKTLIQKYISLFNQNQEKVLVLVHARILRSWLDAFLIHIGLDCGSEVRIVNGIPVVLCPEILIHPKATSIDVFRAFIIANRVSYIFSKKSISTTISSAAAALQYQNNLQLQGINTTTTTLVDKEIEILQDLGLTPTDLLLLVEEAYKYEQDNYHNITTSLTTAGWITDRFMFGTIKRRVEW